MGVNEGLAYICYSHKDNIGVEQSQLDVNIAVSTFPNFKQNSEGGSNPVNATGNIKLDATVSRNNHIKTDKLINPFNILLGPRAS